MEPDQISYSGSMFCVLDEQDAPRLKIFVIFDGNIVRVREFSISRVRCILISKRWNKEASLVITENVYRHVAHNCEFLGRFLYKCIAWDFSACLRLHAGSVNHFNHIFYHTNSGQTRKNRSFNIPPPWAFDAHSCPRGRAFDHYS